MTKRRVLKWVLVFAGVIVACYVALLLVIATVA